jgi:peptide/nickel transport system substrate-binding protein
VGYAALAVCTAIVGSSVTGTARAAVATSAAVCAGKAPNIPLSKRPELRMRLSTQDMSTFDPAAMTTVGSWWVGQQIYSQLVGDPSGIADSRHLRSDLASKWTVSKNGLVYTFFLRKNAKWQGGYGNVTSADVKFSFDRIKDPATGSSYQAQFAPITTVAVNKYTVQLRLKKPYPSLLTDVLPSRPGFIVSKNAIAKLGAQTYFQHPYGSGPFAVDFWHTNSEVHLVANDNYYRGAPKISGIDFKVISNEGSAAIALQSGSIDGAVFTTPASFLPLTKDPNIRVGATGSIAGYYLDLNTRVAPMNNVNVRRALWYAIDRKAISSSVFGGMATPLGTILPPTLWSYTPKVATYDYNVAKAKQLLAQAGYASGFTLSILYSAGGAPEALALAVQSMWREIGVKVTLAGLDHGAYNTEEATHRDKYSIVLAHFGRSTDPDSFLTGAFASSGFPPGNNFSYYSASDKLIDQARTEPNASKRKALYQQVQKQLQTSAPAIPVVHDIFTMAFRSNVCGYVTAANTVFTAYGVWIK